MSRYIRGDVIDPDVTISRSDGSVLCTKSALTSPVELTCTLDATGEHAIIAADLGRDETGDYCISLQRMNGPAKVIPISYGSGRTNFIYVPCAIHAYAFNGAAGDRVAVRMARTSGIFPDLRLHRPDGSQLCGDSTLETLASNLELECILDVNGRHVIFAANATSDDVGGYCLFLRRPDSPANPLPIGYGDSVAGSLPAPCVYNTYVLNGTAGDRLTLRAAWTQSPSGPEAILSSSDGTELCRGAAPNSEVLELNCVLDSALRRKGLYIRGDFR
jgi:hypothetical protein